MVDVLHINDNQLRLHCASEQFVSQGYAWLAGEQVHFDLNDDVHTSSVKRCRLAPQEINNRYWMQCDQSAISQNVAGMRHAADLIWQHLSQLKQRFNLSELALVVPSHYRAENLQLLLGVAKACDLQIKALINKASLAVSLSEPIDGDYIHLDVQLHQTVSSRLNLSDGTVSLGEVEIIQDVGIHVMQEALLRGLQDSFIKNDRFDPLHDANTEQQLFDQLPQIAEHIVANGKANIGVEHQGKLHSTSIDAKDWNTLLGDFSSRLAQASSGQTFVDLNSAFGATSLTGLSDIGVITLHGTPVFDSEVLVNAQGADSAVVYQTDLPIPGTTAAPVTRKSPTSAVSEVANKITDSVPPNSDTATHLLSAGKAISITRAQVSMDGNVLSISAGDATNVASLLVGGKLFVMNDEGRTQLKPNDRLGSHLADGVITVIQVE